MGYDVSRMTELIGHFRVRAILLAVTKICQLAGV